MQGLTAAALQQVLRHTAGGSTKEERVHGGNPPRLPFPWSVGIVRFLAVVVIARLLQWMAGYATKDKLRREHPLVGTVW